MQGSAGQVGKKEEEKMIYNSTQIEEIKGMIKEPDWFFIKVLDIDYSDLSNIRMLIRLNEDAKKVMDIVFVNCKSVSYETDANWRRNTYARQQSFEHLGHVGHGYDIYKTNNGMHCFLHLYVNLIHIECEEIRVNKRRMNKFKFFWQGISAEESTLLFDENRRVYEEGGFENGFSDFEQWIEETKEKKFKLVDITNEYFGDEIRVTLVDEEGREYEIHCLLCYSVKYKSSEDKNGKALSRKDIIRGNDFGLNPVEFCGFQTVKGSTYPERYCEMIKIRLVTDKIVMDWMCGEVRVYL